MKLTLEEYTLKYGAPVQDEYERATCDKAGTLGHISCGICAVHDRPHFMCGCGALAYAAEGRRLEEALVTGWLRRFSPANQRADYIRRRKAGWSPRFRVVRTMPANPMY